MNSILQGRRDFWAGRPISYTQPWLNRTAWLSGWLAAQEVSIRHNITPAEAGFSPLREGQYK